MVVPQVDERGNIVGENAVDTQKYLTTFGDEIPEAAAANDPSNEGLLSKLSTPLLLLLAAAVGFAVFGGDM